MKIAGLTLALAAGLVMPSWAQQDNVLFLNASERFPNRSGMENRTCVVPRAWVSSDHLCPGFFSEDFYETPYGRLIQINKASEAWKFLEEGYFIQGHRIELQVINRKFLSDYSITIDGVTQLQSGPNIRNLNEAENLSLGAASFASIPPSKGGTEGLTARTAAQILRQLLDEETSSQPIEDLNNDYEVIQREFAKLTAMREDFESHYDLILGTEPLPNCPAVLGAPSVIRLRVCLDLELITESGGVWTAAPFTDEQGFRNVNTRVQDLIAAVNTLGMQLANTDLPTKLKALETAVAQYDNDVTTFLGNIRAARDAAQLILTVNDFRRKLRREELKVLLLDKLKGPDSKSTLDPAELNQFVQSFQALGDVGEDNADDLEDRADQIEAEFNNLEDVKLGLADFRFRMNVELPRAINELNASQGQLLNRVNFIYDHSEVFDPLPKQIDLTGHSGNLLVYFSIRRIEGFQRYTVAQVQGPGAGAPTGTGVQTSNGAMALPPAAPATPPAGNATTTTTQTGLAQGTAPNTPPANTTSGSTTPSPSNTTPTIPPSPPSNTGIVVAKGVFQVHEFFHANVVAAIAFSTLKKQTITQQAQPQSCTGTAANPDSSCFAPLVASSHSWAPIIGLDYYFQARDSYPRTDLPWLCRQHAWQCFGVMGAMSAIKGNDYFLGGFFEPKQGVQVGFGANFGVRTELQNPYKAGIPVDISGSFPTSDQRGTGLFISAGLDLGIFRKVFGKFTGIGTSASSTSGQ